MSTDTPMGSASPLLSPAHASGEGIDGPVILKQQIQPIPIFPFGKVDAQANPTDMKSGVPNDSTYHPPSQDYITALMKQVADLNIRISHFTPQTLMAVTDNNNSVQQDDNTDPLKRPTRAPLSSDPTTITARIFIRIPCLFILVIILLQTFYAHYNNLRDSRFWWSAAYDWWFATDTLNTKVGTPLK
ncbi:uncharacterized protein LACBIDRAFT_333895 [Laccaria bicolor S238N-H82]|uniref:Predicted protein n=1 Tax=Laccaria bicolor (strain S238N-H82 / ATCC MYA-4686) TaxID=486041 RepID=B0DXF3_LACBS|nr:uncharacterized protein LACBIDRAFT_333895 [Laccaria bicolor S238N-H82]EDR00610.1 predicted protein [Laccaria bicolor S238N-H82]|eukprot:XP_001888619.1 predicted protein [Laccaria bicolor S238N-H82]